MSAVWDDLDPTLQASFSLGAGVLALALYFSVTIGQAAWVVTFMFFGPLAGALVLIPLLTALWRGVQRASLFRNGMGVRGIVVARDVHGGERGGLLTAPRYFVDYRFQVGDEQHEGQCRVSEEVFVGADPGDEVAVWYSPGNPSRSVISLVDTDLGRLE